jgi:hypothetical protein
MISIMSQLACGDYLFFKLVVLLEERRMTTTQPEGGCLFYLPVLWKASIEMKKLVQ